MVKKYRMAPDHIVVRGARVHNLKNLDVDIPLGRLVGIAGVSGSGKSSLALGVLYAEGSRRYLESLSTYTRRRMTIAQAALLDDIDNVPAALALRQRPAVPGIRSTFGTSTELLNTLRLMFSRLASHRCPNGHYLAPTPDVAIGKELVCPICGAVFMPPGAESLAFNSDGACRTCGGTGIVRTVDESTLVPDESLTIDEGAVAPWNSLMWSLMTDVCRAMGVRTDVPFHELTPAEREIVFHGPAEKKHIFYHSKSDNNRAGELDFTYYNAVYTVENALAKVKDDKGMKRVEKFLRQDICPDCGGSRLSDTARAPRLCGKNLAEASAMTLDALIPWVQAVPDQMPREMREMAETIVDQFLHTAERLIDLGLGYLALDRASNTLSTGERQRVQLARAVRNRTTGVLYVLDEPSIGLHPVNVDGLLGVIEDLLAHGNSVVLVDHDTRVLRAADHLIELGPGAGANGGRLLSQGTVAEVAADPHSLIGPFLTGKAFWVRERVTETAMFDQGRIHLETAPLHTVQALDLDLPRGRLICVTGVSGSGKTTLILESLVPALTALINETALPVHVRAIEAEGIHRVNLIDATPIGTNVRSTVATYAGVMDELRRAFARTPQAREAGYKAGAFSYNTGSLRCSECDGTGQITMDVQFLPDVEITCPACGGSRYSETAGCIKRVPKGASEKEGRSLPEMLALTVDEALAQTRDIKKAHERLQTLSDLGLGYLTLGEGTPALSGGEAQRLKLAAEIGREQSDAVFVFDEPTIGLHPLDVRTLITIFQRLIDQGATVVVIEHDLDMIANSDYIIDMGPGGGESGGRIVACGTPEVIAKDSESVTGRYLQDLV